MRRLRIVVALRNADYRFATIHAVLNELAAGRPEAMLRGPRGATPRPERAQPRPRVGHRRRLGLCHEDGHQRHRGED